MADIQQDLLGLQYSQNFAIQGMQEADIDLNLSPVTNISATVYGKVTDGTNPIPNATVKLFDNKGMPYKHTLTDDSGEYSMDGVPAGTYSIGTGADLQRHSQRNHPRQQRPRSRGLLRRPLSGGQERRRLHK